MNRQKGNSNIRSRIGSIALVISIIVPTMTITAPPSLSTYNHNRHTLVQNIDLDALHYKSGSQCKNISTSSTC